MSLSNLYPSILPSLTLDFINSRTIHPLINFSRNTIATRFNELGVLETISANQHRNDYDPVTLSPRGLLIEEARTNSIRNNTMVGAVAGTPGTLPTNWNVGTAAGLTTNVIGTGTESGVAYVDVQVVGTPTGTAYTLFFDAATQIAALNAQTWSSSLWCKIAAGATTNITSINNNITFRDSGGTSLQSLRTAMTLSSTLARYAQAQTATNASTAFSQAGLWFTVTVGVAIDITLRIGLPQLELGAFATSVIPTSNSAVTRNADLVTMSVLTPWFNQTSGTIYAEASIFGLDNISRNLVTFSNGTSSNYMSLFRQSDSQPVDQVIVSETNQFFTGIGTNWTLSSERKMTLTYEINDFAGSIDGQTTVTDTSGTIPSVNKVNIGSNAIDAGFLCGHMRKIMFYNRRLSNTLIKNLTTL